MKIRNLILSLSLLFLLPVCLYGQKELQNIKLEFYGDTIELPGTYSSVVDFNDSLSNETISSFYQRMLSANYQPVIAALAGYKETHKPDDWLFYQLIRKTAQLASPKAANYHRYTLYKWFLLNKLGYDAVLRYSGSTLLFYVQSDENIYDIPYCMRKGKQYVCLNYHDYGYVDFEKNKFREVAIIIPEAQNAFSYKLTALPNFNPKEYQEKDLNFNYHNVDYHFRVKLNMQVNTILANYPVTDYQSYFDAPLSRETYQSLIPQLKNNLEGMSVKEGVDYLMHFTRYAFPYQSDSANFGKEKRLAPEQTLIYSKSDCEDRAALFYCLVKEIYNLPMIVLAFPHHVSIAVKFDKPVGIPIMFNGVRYSICEPTPQKKDLSMGELSKDLKTAVYEVAYAYTPR